MMTKFIPATLWIMLGSFNVLAVAIAFWDYSGSSDAVVLNDFIENHSSLLLALGTLLLVSGLTVLSAMIVSASQERVERQNRENSLLSGRIEKNIRKELKLSEYRQIWIGELRDDLAEYVSLLSAAVSSNSRKVSNAETVVSMRIYLRLNHSEDLPEKLRQAVMKFQAVREEKSDDVDKEQEEFHKALHQITKIGQKILKAEWSRLKDDLDSSMKLPDSLQ